MSDLSGIEKRKLERALGMGGGYVLNFSDRTFAEFFQDNFKLDIYDPKYNRASGSKANRMRAFWDEAPNHVVAKVLRLLFTEWKEFVPASGPPEPPRECLAIVCRLEKSSAVDAIDAIRPEGSDQDFEVLANALRDSIKKNKPEEGLDRLHTYVTKLVRIVAENRNIDTAKTKPLHSIFGEYVKRLRDDGLIESKMTERILKSSIGTMEAFNDIRNNRSLAHDNRLLNYEESLLIFNHICSAIRFIRALEGRAEKKPLPEHVDCTVVDGLPF